MTDIERSWADQPRTRSLPTTTERTTTMKHFTKARTLTVAVATGSAVVLAGGVAYAFWNASGTGTAAAKATSVTGVTGAVATITTQPAASLLYPGGPAITAVVNVHNTNASIPVKVTAISVTAAASPASVIGGTDNAACVLSPGVSLAAGSLGSLTTVIAGGGDATFNLGQVTMTSASADGCQGATFTFASTVTAQVG